MVIDNSLFPSPFLAETTVEFLPPILFLQA